LKGLRLDEALKPLDITDCRKCRRHYLDCVCPPAAAAGPTPSPNVETRPGHHLATLNAATGQPDGLPGIDAAGQGEAT
jgi:hypothetical protein